jgi:hypothetical protein
MNRRRNRPVAGETEDEMPVGRRSGSVLLAAALGMACFAGTAFGAKAPVRQQVAPPSHPMTVQQAADAIESAASGIVGFEPSARPIVVGTPEEMHSCSGLSRDGECDGLAYFDRIALAQDTYIAFQVSAQYPDDPYMAPDDVATVLHEELHVRGVYGGMLMEGVVEANRWDLMPSVTLRAFGTPIRSTPVTFAYSKQVHAVRKASMLLSGCSTWRCRDARYWRQRWLRVDPTTVGQEVTSAFAVAGR